MVGPRNSKELSRSPPKSQPSGATRRTAVGLLLGAPLLGACSGIQQTLSQFSTSGPAQEPIVAGTGQVKVGLILPLSAPGNASRLLNLSFLKRRSCSFLEMCPRL